MNNSDKPKLRQILNAMCFAYGKENFTVSEFDAYFNTLKSMSVEDVAAAIDKHALDPDSGKFFPRPIDFLRSQQSTVDLSKIKPDEILAMAISPTTPLGVIARIEIGTFTLFNETDPFHRRQSALVFAQKLPNIAARAISGKYTPHEIATMQKLSVSPKSPLYHGMSSPTQEALQNIKNTYHQKKDDARYLVAAGDISNHDYTLSITEPAPALPPPSKEDIEKAKEQFKHLGNGIGADLHEHIED